MCKLDENLPIKREEEEVDGSYCIQSLWCIIIYDFIVDESLQLKRKLSIQLCWKMFFFFFFFSVNVANVPTNHASWHDGYECEEKVWFRLRLRFFFFIRIWKFPFVHSISTLSFILFLFFLTDHRVERSSVNFNYRF